METISLLQNNVNNKETSRFYEHKTVAQPPQGNLPTSVAYQHPTGNMYSRNFSIERMHLLGRHAELEQSKTKAQGALVTVLSLTQITELKLLLDIGRQGHKFYDFVLTMLITCIALELFVGMIIIYIGNLRYYQESDHRGWCGGVFRYFWCCCRACQRWSPKRNGTYGTYLSVRAASSSAHTQLTSAAVPPPQEEEDVNGCCEFNAQGHRLETIIDLERADSHIENAKVKVADATVRIVRQTNYVKVMEDAVKKSSRSAELEEELNKAKEELNVAIREREEAEAEQKLAEAQQRQAFYVKEAWEDREERVVTKKITFWQHCATYLLYFVMLMNIFITTFGISGGAMNSVYGFPTNNTMN